MKDSQSAKIEVHILRQALIIISGKASPSNSDFTVSEPRTEEI